MKSINKSNIAFCASVFAFCACENDCVTESVPQTSLEKVLIIEDVSGLPYCTSDNEGEQIFVRSEKITRICVSGQWFATQSNSSVKNEEGLTCIAEKTADNAGFNIVCNGHFVGVVTNGRDGVDGKDGVDGRDGVDGKDGVDGRDGIDGKDGVNGRDGVDGKDGADGRDGVDGKDGTDGRDGVDGKDGADGRDGVDGKDGADGRDGVDGKNGIDGKDGSDGVSCEIVGQSQYTATIACGDKSVVVYLGSGKNVSIESLFGYAQIGPMPFIKGSSIYLTELTDACTPKQHDENNLTTVNNNNGQFVFSSRDLTSEYVLLAAEGKRYNISDEKNIKLKAISNVLDNNSININQLTHLEYNRVYHLVTRDGMSIAKAKMQAQSEIFKEFHMKISKYIESEKMNLYGNSDADAALMAISLIVMFFDDKLSLDDLAYDIEIDGIWNDSVIKVSLADRISVQEHYSDLYPAYRNRIANYTENIPNFERYVRSFWSGEFGLGDCDSEGLVKKNQNLKSTRINEYFTCKNGYWQMATDIEMDTVGWGNDYVDGHVRNGNVNTTYTYVFENGNWRLGTALDSLLYKAGGIGCIVENDTSKVKYNDVYYVCTKQSGIIPHTWEPVLDVYNDTYEERDECRAGGKYGDGTLLAGHVHADKIYACDNSNFREATKKEIKLNKGCVSYIYGTNYKPEDQLSYYKCTADGWIFDVEANLGTLIDPRGEKTYKTITIGTHVVMSENLDVDYTVNSKSYGVHCYHDSCSVYGRLYTYAAAMDSAGIYSYESSGCGYNRHCSPQNRPRGICPNGWHIPSIQELQSLYSYVDSSVYSMQATGFESWPNATDSYGLSVKPGSCYSGYEYVDGKHHLVFQGCYVGNVAGIWSSTTTNETSIDAQLAYIQADRIDVGNSTRNPKYNFYGVRCFKNVE